jgi:hypothetical protein
MRSLGLLLALTVGPIAVGGLVGLGVRCATRERRGRLTQVLAITLTGMAMGCLTLLAAIPEARLLSPPLHHLPGLVAAGFVLTLLFAWQSVFGLFTVTGGLALAWWINRRGPVASPPSCP